VTKSKNQFIFLKRNANIHTIHKNKEAGTINPKKSHNFSPYGPPMDKTKQFYLFIKNLGIIPIVV
jgi:hypothetical protein